MAAVSTPRTVEAEKIILRDSHGRARLTLGTPEFAGATVDMKPDNPVVWLTDEKGIDRAVLTIDGLFFSDSQRKPTADFRNSPKSGMSTLRFYAPDGKISWSAP